MKNKTVTKNNGVEKKPFQLGIRFTRKDEKLIKAAIKRSGLECANWCRIALIHTAAKQTDSERRLELLKK